MRGRNLERTGAVCQSASMPDMDRDSIVLQGIQVPAALGVSKAEREMRRPVRIELELETDLRRSGRSDRRRAGAARRVVRSTARSALCAGR